MSVDEVQEYKVIMAAGTSPRMIEASYFRIQEPFLVFLDGGDVKAAFRLDTVIEFSLVTDEKSEK